MFNEMRGSEGVVRPAYAELSQWLEQIAPDTLDFRRREAELFFRRIGITFAVYGDKAQRTSHPLRRHPADHLGRRMGGPATRSRAARQGASICLH